MTPVKMFIEKFGKEVIIEDNHPLAIAQREKEAKAAAEQDASAKAKK